MTEALPCPFCGANEGLTMADGSTHRWGIAYCNGCGASAGEVRRSYPDDGKWYEEAIQQWNQRATPPQREWQGLTDEEIKEIVGLWGDTPIKGYTRKLFDQIEVKLKEKNT